MTPNQPLPLDDVSAATLAARGLDYRLVDPASEAFPGFLWAMNRGFLGPESTPEQVEGTRQAMQGRRLVGVYDRGSDRPVATVASWPTPLTVSPGRTVPAWAISGVTVAGTHRRNGIARAMVEGELRTAAAAGLPLAGLTVSEATIYGRFGFGPAVYVTGWTIDTRRARWIGPRPGGRLDAIDRESLQADLAELHERVRERRPGEVAGWPGLWRRLSGLAPGQPDGDKVRGVRYTDEAGTTRGVVAYTVDGGEDDFTRHTLHIGQLIADGEAAYAALWRYVLEHDLVGTVRADLLSGEEPLRWMIADQRGAAITQDGHHWLRVLDVPAALVARSYRAPAGVVLRVVDPLGLAEGTWRVEIAADGSAWVEPSAAEPDVTMPVAALSSILLGGVRTTTLVEAGVVAASSQVAGRLDLAFAPQSPPRLSLWY